MRILVFCALGLLLGVFAFVWLVSRVRYRIGSRHVKVLLFGLPVRRVALTNIEAVSKRPGSGWTERWWSTFKPKHRLLVLRRRRSLLRNFAITPKNRYVFKTDLERAMQRAGNTSVPPVEEEAGNDEERQDQRGANGEAPEHPVTDGKSRA